MLSSQILVIAAIAGYAVATGLLLLRLFGQRYLPRIWLQASVVVALGFHAALLYQWIDVSTGQNLAFFNVLSQVMWLITALVAVASLRQPLESLGLLIYPLTLLSIVLRLLFPGTNLFDTSVNPAQLFHILLSMFAFSVLAVAAIQALLLALQEQLLRRKLGLRFVQALPPLVVMEGLLFQMIWVGFLLLTLVIVTSLYFFYNILASHVLQKTILATTAWFTFAILLIGRNYYGWRGQTAIRWTLSGVAFLLVLIGLSTLL